MMYESMPQVAPFIIVLGRPEALCPICHGNHYVTLLEFGDGRRLTAPCECIWEDGDEPR